LLLLLLLLLVVAWSLGDVCFAMPSGFRDPVQPPWEDRTQPLVPALANTGDPDSQPAEIDGARVCVLVKTN
jgi:hypothetical protein